MSSELPFGVPPTLEQMTFPGAYIHGQTRLPGAYSRSSTSKCVLTLNRKPTDLSGGSRDKPLLVGVFLKS